MDAKGGQTEEKKKTPLAATCWGGPGVQERRKNKGAYVPGLLQHVALPLQSARHFVTKVNCPGVYNEKNAIMLLSLNKDERAPCNQARDNIIETPLKIPYLIN